MPTLDEAARGLRISEKTLRRWIKVLNAKYPRQQIVPTRHEWDGRYLVISEEDVQRIAEARRQMPGHINKYLNVALRSPSADSRYSEASPTSTPAPRARPLRRDTFAGLPDGLVSRSDAATRHNIALTTLRRWCESGQVETDAGVYAGEMGRFAIASPITAQGMRQLYQLASERADFRRCAACPHDT